MAYQYPPAAEEASSSQQSEAHQEDFGSVPTLFGDEDANNNAPGLIKRRASRHPRKKTSASAMAFNFLIQKVRSCNSFSFALPSLIVHWEAQTRAVSASSHCCILLALIECASILRTSGSNNEKETTHERQQLKRAQLVCML